MAVYRVNKNRGYTVMANYHLRDKTLSLKAVGLLSKMLSFNDGWQFSTKGLSAICKEGPDAVLAALRELEDHGYLVRHRQRDAKGRMSNTVFEIYEQPQPVSPHMENPDVDNPDMENPDMENPHGDNPAQLNTNQVITNERNNSLNNYQSINLDGMDRMGEREQYRELIRDNLEIDIRSQDRRYDLDRVNEIVEIMLDAVCSTSPTIRINGEDMPQPVVKSRFLKLDSGHIDYELAHVLISAIFAARSPPLQRPRGYGLVFGGKGLRALALLKSWFVPPSGTWYSLIVPPSLSKVIGANSPFIVYFSLISRNSLNFSKPIPIIKTKLHT